MKHPLFAIIGLAFLSCASTGQHASGYRSISNEQALFPVTRLPQESTSPGGDWDFVPFIERFEVALPSKNRNEIRSWRIDELKLGRSTHYDVTMESDSSGDEKCLSAELSRMLIQVPYSEFVKKLPPETWGTHLAHYLGGEVHVLARDAKNRSLRQVERMVLSSLPSDLDSTLFNQDMTKAEILLYGEDFAKVYWRVYHSDNGSTEADIGSVEFMAFGEDATLVTFHSAHKVNTVFGIPVPHVILGPMLSSTFIDHLEKYRALFPQSSEE